MTRNLTTADAPALATFFAENNLPDITRHFHPFPLDADTAIRICNLPRRDRYFAFFAFPDTVATLIAWPETALPAVTEVDGITLLDHAGLGVSRHGGAVIIASAAQAGAFMAWSEGRLAHADAGYVALTTQGRRWASDRHAASGWTLARGERGYTLTYRGQFRDAERPRPFEKLGPLLHSATRLLGVLPDVARAAGEALKRRYVAEVKDRPLEFSRRVEVDRESVTVVDLILGEAPLAVLTATANPGTTHVPSAQVWLPAFEPALVPSLEGLAAKLRSRGRVEITSRLTLASKPSLDVEVD